MAPSVARASRTREVQCVPPVAVCSTATQWINSLYLWFPLPPPPPFSLRSLAVAPSLAPCACCCMRLAAHRAAARTDCGQRRLVRAAHTKRRNKSTEKGRKGSGEGIQVAWRRERRRRGRRGYSKRRADAWERLGRRRCWWTHPSTRRWRRRHVQLPV